MVRFILIMSGIICRSVGVLPLYDLIASCVGTGLLAGMAYLWHDRALLMVNGVACSFIDGNIETLICLS